jgi:hypothetical protein
MPAVQARGTSGASREAVPLPDRAMLKEASTLPEAASDCLDALLHLSLLAASSGYPDCARAAQTAVRELLASPDAGCVIPAEYQNLEQPR